MYLAVRGHPLALSVGNTPPPRLYFCIVTLDEVVPVEMATDVVVGVSCAHIGLSLLRLLGVGDGREEESKSSDMNVIVCCVWLCL